MEILPTGGTCPLQLSFHPCQFLYTRLIEKPVRITKPWGRGPLTWIRFSPNWHLVFLTLHYNCEWECMRASTAHGSAGWRTVLASQPAWLSVRVGRCEWVTGIYESERDRNQREEDRKTKRLQIEWQKGRWWKSLKDSRRWCMRKTTWACKWTQQCLWAMFDPCYKLNQR